MSQLNVSKKPDLNSFIKNNSQHIIPLLFRIFNLDYRLEYILKDAYGEMGNNFVICDKRPYKFGVLGFFTAAYDKKTTEIILTLGKCDDGLFKDFNKGQDDIEYKISLCMSPKCNTIHWALEFSSKNPKIFNSMQFIFNSDGTRANCSFDKNSKKSWSSELCFISPRTLLDQKFLNHIHEFVTLFFENPEIFKIYSVSDVIDAFPNKEDIKEMDLVVEMVKI